ncbi:spore germination protein, GerA family [Desulfitobacterium dichloroeliminans LMG P-21439]|uniref:Spore germination protein, GerA family n=1 Tax=Desulfitobacterium dichloroeliminans (strain LMG P-21439 / DCA1) TaxID=871963 RepID=L0F931_DESDL|nr:spore germination protein [Desulfitobacterium dichloroeliminans]AGA69712.1 spore germination protein, GerA family [Desulfitobacterium dichloroeliminans LMG P-21439]
MSNNKPVQISESLEKIENQIRSIFGNSADLSMREFGLGSMNQGLLVFIEGLVEQEYISTSILKPLMDFSPLRVGDIPPQPLVDVLRRQVLINSKIEKVNTYEEVTKGLLVGKTALFLEQAESALLLNTFGGKTRSVDKPETEVTVRGPREGFIENLSTNTSLLRRKISDENLRIESMVLGQRTKTQINIAYIEGLANPKLVVELKSRLKSIDIDAILESGYIEQLIEDTPQSIFPTVGNTEKPDKLAAKLLEGRVGVLVDGTPFALTVPYLFVEAFQNPEDYYSRPYYTSIIRLIRYLCFYFSTMLPAFYVAIQSFHQEMLPTSLLINMSAGREGIPFPVIIEALMMGLMYEILREAGVRMPRNVGQAVSIVGALVLGEAAVQAGIVSQAMVIVVSLTAISGFLIPPLTSSMSLLRLYFLIATGFLGMFGWLISLLALSIHMGNIRSFGIIYLSPLIPSNLGDLKDGMVRFPLWAMISRPSLLGGTGRQSKKGMLQKLARLRGNKN